MLSTSSGRRRHRLAAFLATAFLAAVTVLQPAAPAAAAPSPCSTDEWQRDPKGCADKLQEVVNTRRECLTAPTPTAPDSGFRGWFSAKPPAASSGVTGWYSQYGYGGFEFHVYDSGCGGAVISGEAWRDASSGMATIEMSVATFVLGLTNAVREKAWSPDGMWEWADPLVQRATEQIYEKVFSSLGVITLAIVGLYLLWRAHAARLSDAISIVGWAVLVMVLVTAVARWPVAAANVADNALTSIIGTVSNAVGPPAQDIPTERCPFPDDPAACRDSRTPAVRASDTNVEAILYANWLRGTLGSSTSETAKRYGRALFQASTMTWDEAANADSDPALRKVIVERKQDEWMRIAEQIKEEDPAAYDYLTGKNSVDRIGVGFIALLSAIGYALFDLMSSLLILLGFLIVRWAVVAAPALGTVALLRPAAAGLRRLVNTVALAMLNVAIFSIGGPAYLAATELVMAEPSLPGWAQFMLIILSALAAWILLRPYRRLQGMITDPIRAMRGLQSGIRHELRRQERRARRRALLNRLRRRRRTEGDEVDEEATAGNEEEADDDATGDDDPGDDGPSRPEGDAEPTAGQRTMNVLIVNYGGGAGFTGPHARDPGYEPNYGSPDRRHREALGGGPSEGHGGGSGPAEPAAAHSQRAESNSPVVAEAAQPRRVDVIDVDEYWPTDGPEIWRPGEGPVSSDRPRPTGVDEGP